MLWLRIVEGVVAGFALLVAVAALNDYVQRKRFEATLTPDELSGFRAWMLTRSWRDYVAIIEGATERTAQARPQRGPHAPTGTV
jgi:hypothetical protein